MTETTPPIQARDQGFQALSIPTGALVGGTTPSWAALSGQKFFHRVFFQAPVAPTFTTIPAGFGSGHARGAVVNDSGSLTTDFKLAAAIVIDDSESVRWCDPSGRRQTEIPALIGALWQRYAATVSVTRNGQTTSETFYPSFADIWTFGTEDQETTGGYTNNLTALSLKASALYANGKDSSLYAAAELAVSGVSPQSIVDAILAPGDAVGNAQRMDAVAQYLQARSLLGLTAVQQFWAAQSFPSQWDGTASDIKNHDDVSTFVAQRFAAGFTPVAFLIADGDDDSSLSAAQVAVTAQSAWGEDGVAVHTYGLGASHVEGGLRQVSALSGGHHFDISRGGAGQDWSAASASFLHGQPNSLFAAHWTRSFDYDLPTWIDSVHAVYTHSAGQSVDSGARAEFRFTRDRLTWSDWSSVQANAVNGQGRYDARVDIKDEVLGLQYRVTLTDGWNGSAPLLPAVLTLEHVVVTPSFQYLITLPQASAGMLFEYLLSAAVDLPRSARLSWGIVRGDSTDFADFETVINGRDGCLPNRQESLQFTPLVVRSGLQTTTTDNAAFQVIGPDSLPAHWTSADQVQVIQGNFPIDNTTGLYSLDGSRGIVYFKNPQLSVITTTVTVTTPQKLYTSIGEPCTSRDQRTYFPANGRWPHDATVIVLVNGAIVRGGYWSSADEGTITFAKERERTDIVTVYVQHAGSFRVGVELRNYGQSPISLDNFGLFFTAQENGSLLFHFRNTPVPSLLSGSLTLQPSGATIYQRLEVAYAFHSVDGNQEQGSGISWWRYRPGETTSGYASAQAVGGHVFAEISAANGLPDYGGRTVQRKADVSVQGQLGLFHQGDQVFVTVTPSDGIHTGTAVNSPIITLLGNQPPVVTAALVSALGKSVNPQGQATVPALAVLQASYTYGDAGGAQDQSLVTWRLQDQPTAFFVGQTIPASTTKKGQILNFEITPYDGQTYGIPQQSDTVIVS